MSRLAWVGNDRQFYTMRPGRDRDALPLTSPLPAGLAGWSPMARPAEAWSWPTWSPDGKWIAGFALEASDDEVGPLRVSVLSVDGVRQERWWESNNAGPIYLQWHPSSTALSVLIQRGEELQLGVIRAGEIGRMRPVESGVPLFFNWTPGGEGVLMHVGDLGRKVGRLVYRDPLGTRDDVVYPRHPGSFCAPVFAGGLAVYAVADEACSELIASQPSGSDSRVIDRRGGLLAIAGAPGGEPLVAVSAASGGQGTAYRGIDIFDLRRGTSRRLTDLECLAYFWSPTGDWLLLAQVAAAENCLRWWKVPLHGEPPVDLGTFWPTRDILFYLHFFDQYTQSHPLVSPDGKWLTWAGYPAGGGQADLSQPAQVYVKHVDTPAEPAAVVASGAFSVWSPVPGARPADTR
ncbi:MAG: PD40 domain-containing protein [Deltaproteobacteria bacterium]|nr:PD40 domain-containing protein [Deltaproteobacteria bacterium]